MPWSGNKKEKVFIVFHLKLISRIPFLLSSVESQGASWSATAYSYQGVHAASLSLPGKSTFLRPALFPSPSPLEQPTALNKELFVRSSTVLNITRTLKTDVLKFPMDFVTGFLPRPPRVLSPCPNGRKLLQLSPEKGLNSEDWLQWLKMRKSEQVPHPASPLPDRSPSDENKAPAPKSPLLWSGISAVSQVLIYFLETDFSDVQSF